MKMNEIRAAFETEITNCQDLQSLQELKVKYLGKSGELTVLLKSIKDLPAEERPSFGAEVNALRGVMEARFAEKTDTLKALDMQRRLQEEKVDISLTSCKPLGASHPVTLIENEICDLLIAMGFEVLTGPEIETDYYNFKALNIPDDHPARDMQDTFYITDSILLRTQTSAMQARLMEKRQPPIKVICPGKVFRSDSDASHSPVFHQIEGLVVDKNITLCDLKGTLEYIASHLFGENTKVRFRPSFFPFTEPSVEVDVTCSNCGGKGCSLCKGTGWIELLGAGMVNPFVLEKCGIDSKKYNGFAFGIGMDRVAMIKYGIPDIRLLFENDQRFLKQFGK
ncbi:MAG: phenylalanine--tRNA ligase subunit alpha [Clostridiales bacterium]|nr:phenylalanine--tRNA ligase subunit alpha [Clostridiales bacterium]